MRRRMIERQKEWGGIWYLPYLVTPLYLVVQSRLDLDRTAASVTGAVGQLQSTVDS